MTLTATYDDFVDALYFRRRSGVAVADTVEMSPRVMVDRGADGDSVGVELLGAARHGVPTGDLSRALGHDVAEQAVADAAVRAIRARTAESPAGDAR